MVSASRDLKNRAASSGCGLNHALAHAGDEAADVDSPVY